MSKRSKCCIVGIPDHLAVTYLSGRLGAAKGPSAFRSEFSKFNGKLIHGGQIADLGDVKNMTLSVEQNHQRAAAHIEEAHSRFGFSVVVGGSHDHGYSHLLGVRAALERVSGPKPVTRSVKIGCINIDAHLDVRKPSPHITSGSPFYLAVESGLLHPTRFIEFGIQSHCNAPVLWNYIQKRKIKVVPFNSVRFDLAAVKSFKQNLKTLARTSDAVVVSLDLDAIARSAAPGVSAPQAEGFSPNAILEMMEIAGRNKKVVSLGIFELNPEHDVDSRTAQLAATCAYHFSEAALSDSATSS